MSDEKNDETNDETQGEYNPSGGVPGHPADPSYGSDFESDDAVDASDEETTDE